MGFKGFSPLMYIEVMTIFTAINKIEHDRSYFGLLKIV